MDISRPIKSDLKGTGSELSQRGSINIIADADNWPKDWSFDMRIASLTFAFWFDCQMTLPHETGDDQTYASILIYCV
jgi:hypothetical protein